MTAEMAGESSAEMHLPDSPGSHESMDDIFDGAFNAVPEGESLHDSTESFDHAFDDEAKTDDKTSKKDENMTKTPETPNHTTSMNSEDNAKETLNEPSKIERSSHDNSSKNDGGWQNDVVDIPHRRELIRQIAQLLKDRKQNPTPKWLKELPYKARKLEEQLYKSAASLEAYLDESTLKHRLKKVAYAITSQFHIAKGGTKTKKKVISSGIGQSTSSSSNQAIPQQMPFDSRLSTDVQGDNIGSGGMTFEKKVGRGNSGNASNSGGEGLSALEQQQQQNQKLQDQILENIRQQQEIMKTLMENGSSGGVNISDGGLNNNSNDQQGIFGNSQNQVADNSMLAAITSQGLMNTAQQTMNVPNQMTSMGLNAGGLGGMNAGGLGGMNAGGLGGMNAGGLGGMNAGGLSGINSGLNTGGFNAGLGNFNPAGLNQTGMDSSGGLNLSAGGMNGGLGTTGSVNPLLAQQLMQQRMQLPGSSQAQMAMMNNVLRNSLTGQSNPSALNAALLASNMNSASATGINPTMPPPNINSVTRSSFSASNGSGLMGGGNNMTGSGNRNYGSGDPSLSPTSFQW